MEQTVSMEGQNEGLIGGYRAFLMRAFRGPAAWCFIALYILATVYLVVAEHVAFAFISLFALLILVVSLLIVLPLTRGGAVPAWEEPASYARKKLWWQCGLLVGYALLLIALPSLLAAVLGAAAGGVFFLAEFIPPLLIALLLGARWRELGFERGHHVWRVAIPLLVVALIPFVIGMLSTPHPTTVMLLYPIAYVISAGIPEEVGFRGVLTTRLIRLAGRHWGIVVASLLFGLVHFAANYGYFHVTALGSLAFCIAFQAPLGLALAVIMQRTRNLVAGILFHGFFDGAAFIVLPLVLPFILQH